MIVRLLLVGFGNVGRGFAKALLKKRGFVEERFNVELRVVGICKSSGSLVDERGLRVEECLKLAEGEGLEKHKNFEAGAKAKEVIRSVEADVVFELTSSDIRTGEPGLTHILEALRMGSHVITSNKAPLALQLPSLMELAERKGVRLMYEASVGGALPLINLYRHTLGINRVLSVYGILNGTSNFVLSKMAEENMSMEAALKEAQELGIAEADPSYDIDGIDTAAKVVILTNSLLGERVSLKDVKVVGIRGVTGEAVRLARKHGYTIKLIGDTKGLEVSPRLVPIGHPLDVSGPLNAVMIETDIAGKITVIGKGAGGEETASALFADLLELLREWS